MFEIAAIIINYNTNILTQECVTSIIDKTNPLINFQIIIVDNCSEEEDYVALKNFCDSHHFKNLKLIRSNINTGFGTGNTIGSNFTNAKYLAFINNDTLFLNDCFTILQSAIEKDKNIGIVGGQSFTENGHSMIAFSHFTSIGKELLGRDFLEKINPKKYPKRKSEYKVPLKVNYVQGSFMFMRSEDFNYLGGFDPNIFLYYEETDLALRLLKKGKSSYLIPDAKYIHYHGASTPKGILTKTELKISLLYIIRKHHSYFSYLFLLNFLRINYFFKSLYKPKYWYLFKILLVGAPLSKSLKTKQQIKPLHGNI